MGLFDYLNFDPSASGNGGLLSGLYNPLMYSPQSAPQTPTQPQYDPMGTPFAAAPQTATDPFGPPPNLAEWAKQFAPASPFNSGAAPIAGFSSPAPQSPLPQSQPAPSPEPQAPQPPTMGNYGGTQFPIFGQPDPAALPPNAMPAGPAQIPQQQAQPQSPQQLPPALGGNNPSSGIASNLNAGFQGFVNAGSPMQAIGNLVGGLMTGQRTDPAGMRQQNLAAEYHATRQTLIENGYPDKQASSMAMLAVMNKDAAKTILPEALSNKEKFGIIGEDQFGGKQYGFSNDRNQTVNGQPINSANATNGSSGAGYLNKGVSAYDPHLPGDQYLQQFAPDVQAAIKSFANGDSTPTGNARKGWAENIIRFAKTWGDKTGQNVNDQTFFEKKKLKTELGASGNSTMGGILDNGESSFKHLAELGKSFAGLGSASYNFPLGGELAHAVNGVGSLAGSSATKGKIGAANTNLVRYGQESTKFYAGTGGGVEERMAALKTADPRYSSSEEQAAFLEKEKSMMLERLDQKLSHIKQTLGEDEGNKIIAKKMPEINRSMAAIDATIAKLKGGDASSPAPVGLPSGWSVKVR